jgi:hypothetical protein
MAAIADKVKAGDVEAVRAWVRISESKAEAVGPGRAHGGDGTGH